MTAPYIKGIRLCGLWFMDTELESEGWRILRRIVKAYLAVDFPLAIASRALEGFDAFRLSNGREFSWMNGQRIITDWKEEY